MSVYQICLVQAGGYVGCYGMERFIWGHETLPVEALLGFAAGAFILAGMVALWHAAQHFADILS